MQAARGRQNLILLFVVVLLVNVCILIMMLTNDVGIKMIIVMMCTCFTCNLFQAQTPHYVGIISKWKYFKVLT